jgi:hypothetical protein
MADSLRAEERLFVDLDSHWTTGICPAAFGEEEAFPLQISTVLSRLFC